MQATSGVFGVVLFALISTSAIAQKPQVVNERASCSTCRIEFEMVAELHGERGETGLPATPIAYTRDSRGYAFIVYQGAPYEIAVHAPDGTLVKRLGARGGGPGEFQFVSMVRIGPGDSLHAFDSRARRRTVFAPHGGAFVRVSSIPAGATEGAVLGGDRIVLNADVMSSSAIGFPLHMLRKDGSIERSFGTRASVVGPEMGELTRRVVSTTASGTILTGAFTEYRVEYWDKGGTRLRALSRQVPEFRPWVLSESPTPNKPPQPAILRVLEDRNGLLWVISRIADPQWKSVVGRDSIQGSTELTYHVTDYSKYFDAMVDVIDPVRGRLISSTRMPIPFGLFTAGEHFLLTSEAADGSVRGEIKQLKLVGYSIAK